MITHETRSLSYLMQSTTSNITKQYAGGSLDNVNEKKKVKLMCNLSFCQAGKNPGALWDRFLWFHTFSHGQDGSRRHSCSLKGSIVDMQSILVVMPRCYHRNMLNFINFCQVLSKLFTNWAAICNILVRMRDIDRSSLIGQKARS